VTRRRRKRKTIQSGQSGLPKSHPESKKSAPPQRLLALLIVAVVAVLLALIFVGEANWGVVIASIITLTVLMLVVIGRPHLLPAILREIGRFFDP
jgi:hypothetical protein